MLLVPAEILRDADACYRVVSSRDPRWDGRLYLGVLSTGVYCRPSCPARTPRVENCRFYPSAAAAVAAGFRACRRCRPDALPGTREDDHRADLAARALRLIRDGEVDAGGVAGLAGRLHVSERHLHRVLVAEVGVGSLRLAATRRAQTARLLIDQTDMGMADVAFAAGFASIRQFNDVMRAEFGCPPRALRRPAVDGRAPVEGGPGLTLRLRYREPYASESVWAFLSARAVPGVESVAVDGALRRRVPAPSGSPAVVEVRRPSAGVVPVRLELGELADLGPVVARVRRWLDLDADPLAVDEALGADPGLAPLVRARPGLRVPGTVDGFELAARAVVGQQVSVAGARTLLGRLVAEVGEGAGFPSAASVAAVGPPALGACGLTRARAGALHRVALEVAEGRLVLDPGADRAAVRAALLAVPGIGPWTAAYIALRALADPDAWPDPDAVLRRDVRAHGWDPDRWRPWRGYAALHVWTAAAAAPRPARTEEPCTPAAVARPRGAGTITFGTDTPTMHGESAVPGVPVPGKRVPEAAEVHLGRDVVPIPARVTPTRRFDEKHRSGEKEKS
jgi:AraC family transcriptional regulator of adaptative response / DNA-3-methyladenine glycosylase II